MARYPIVFGLFSLALSVISAEHKLVVAKGGQTAYRIVIPTEAHRRVTAAASDLRHYISRRSGVAPTIVSDADGSDGPAFYIGSCRQTPPDCVPSVDTHPETYAIQVRDRDVFLTGRYPTPVSFAVHSFIEDALGVRWFAPGDDWEYVPPVTLGELILTTVDRVKEPGTSPRVWSGHQWYDSWKDWCLRNKAVLSEVVPRRQFQNRLHSVFPSDKYGEAHPEYYPLIKRKRWIPPPKGDTHWRPCESNPDVLQKTIEYARTWFDSHPDIDSFSLGMDDISRLCSCDGCRAMDPALDSYEKREFSDRHYMFVNQVARGVAETHPDRYIGTLIYNIARELPETVPMLEPNVFGFITETSALWWREGRKEADQALTNAWAKRCKHMSRYDYFGMGTLTPRVYPHAMDEQIKFDKSLGLEGMYIEVYTFLPHTAPMIWALAKLQWDHTLDIDRLLGEFYERMYGSAAPVMEEYFDLLECSWNTPREGREQWVHRRLHVQARAMSTGDLDMAFALLDQALASTVSPACQKRIRMHRDALQFSGYAIRISGLSGQLIALEVTSLASAKKAIELSRRISVLAREREVYYAEVPKRDDLFGLNVRGLTEKMSYMPIGQFAALESAGAQGLIRAMSWLAANAPDEMARLAESLGNEGPAVGLVSAWLWVQTNSPENLLKNSAFEETKGHAVPQERDWTSEGAPPAWSMWSRTSRAGIGQKVGYGRGSTVGLSFENAESATLIQPVPVKPGETYLCVVYARGKGGRLSIRYQDAQSRWHKDRHLEASATVPSATDQWQPVFLMVQVPVGAARLLVMPGASGQKDGHVVVFDDAALYKLP